MLRRWRLETWTAGLSAAIAAGCVLALLRGVSPRSTLLLTAEAAAAIGVVSLLLSLLLAWFLRRRKGIEPTPPRPDRSLRQPVDLAASMRRRRQVLEQRLAIDAPHLCSQYQIACTCWSFCAGAVRPGAGEGALPAHAVDPMQDRSAQARGMDVVQRSGMDSCPIRFAAEFADPAQADQAKPDKSATGNGAR